jgi:hypothetical protein
MTRKIVAAGFAGLALAAAVMPAASPALAEVSKDARKACEAKADRAQLRADEREAFIANCLADATATKGN